MNDETKVDKSFNVLRIMIDSQYEGGTRPEGEIYTFSRAQPSEGISSGWKIAHWEEIFHLLGHKFFLSQLAGKNCGLIHAARAFFSGEENMRRLADLVNTFDLSLPEMSLVIKEGYEQTIFIPNISVSNAHGGKFVQHRNLDDFFAGPSYNLIRNVTQSCAAMNQDYVQWARANAERAADLLRASLNLDVSGHYVHGKSPDVVLRSLGHRPYSEIAGSVSLGKTLETSV